MKTRTKQDGSMLVIVMCIAGLLLLMGLSLAFLTGNSAFTARKLTTGVQALAVAEAGVADMLSKMQTDFFAWSEASVTSQFGGGTYVVTTTVNPDNGNVTISSTGTIGGQTRTTILEVLGTKDWQYDQALGLDGVILAKGNIRLDTGALNINGTVHANGSILHDTGNTTVSGNTTACGENQLNNNPPYSNLAGVAEVEIPDYRPFNDWATIASNDNYYFNGSKAFAKTNMQPPHGVVYVNGDVSFANQSALTGTLVASGNIKFENQFTHTPFNTNWPALLAGGNVELKNRDNYYGVIFAGGNIYSINRKDITGALIAHGNVECRNGFGIAGLGHYPDWNPNGTNQTAPQVLVGGWLQ